MLKSAGFFEIKKPLVSIVAHQGATESRLCRLVFALESRI